MQKAKQRALGKDPGNANSSPELKQEIEAIRRRAVEIPEPPRTGEFMLSNATPEAVVKFMAATQHEIVLVVSGEGTPLLIALGHYSQKVTTDEMCDIWSGARAKVNRVSQEGEGIVLNNPRMAGMYAIQPNKANDLAKSKQASDQGFLSRKLFTRTVDRPLQKAAERRAHSKPDLTGFGQRIREILGEPPPDARRAISADAEAETIFDDFHDEHVLQLGPGGRYADTHSPWGARVLEHVCRLAVIVEVLWNGIDAEFVTAPSMERAIRLVRYFDQHYWAIFGDDAATDPVSVFARERIVPSPGARLEKEGLFEAFKEAHPESGLEEREFTSQLQAEVDLPAVTGRKGARGTPGSPRYRAANKGHYRGFKLIPASESDSLEERPG